MDRATGQVVARELRQQRAAALADRRQRDERESPEELAFVDGGEEAVLGLVEGVEQADVLGPDIEAVGAPRTQCRSAAQAQRALADMLRVDRLGFDQVAAPDEVGHEVVAREAVDVVRIADLLDATALHDHDAVRHRQRLLLVMGHHQGGHAQVLLQLPDFGAQAHAFDRVERRQRLVEQQQVGLGRQRARQGDALLLAARELGRVFVLAAGQSDQPEHLVDALLEGLAAGAPLIESVGHVLADIQVRKQGIGLEDDTVVARGRRQPGDVAARMQDLPAVLPLEAGNRAQQGGLAAARGTEQDQEFAALDRELDVVQGREAAELLVQASDFKMSHMRFLGMGRTRSRWRTQPLQRTGASGSARLRAYFLGSDLAE